VKDVELVQLQNQKSGWPPRPRAKRGNGSYGFSGAAKRIEGVIKILAAWRVESSSVATV